MSESGSTQTRSFQAETRQLLDLMIHSLYSHREIFLRELISNASDALDKLRFEAIEKPELLADGTELEIHLEVDADARTLTIRDNGVGMSRGEVIENIGTIAHSGTRELMKELAARKDRPEEELIGQFGVGFYSAFMVAKSVELVTRRAGSEDAVRWQSDGKGEYTLADATREQPGTTITLALIDADEDSGIDDFADPLVLRRVVKQYSDFVRYPIRLAGETVNSMKATWKKRRSEASKEELDEFYKQNFHDWQEPLRAIQIAAEGGLEYHALLYIPKKSPLDLFYPSHQWGLTLYVKNVKIMDHCEQLLPRHLRFVRGIVDCSDLPLNVSRELLQVQGQIRILKNGVTRKVMGALRDMLRDEREAYTEFWQQFGPILKEGMTGLGGGDDKLAELCLFDSSKSESPATLAEYVERMPEDQESIYYLTGESKELLENSPHLEAFRARGIELLYLTDPVDEFVVQSLQEFDKKPLKSAARGALELGTASERLKEEESREELEKEYSGVLLKLGKVLEEEIKEARLSTRLTDSPVCLVSGEEDMSPQLERLLRQGNQQVPKQRRILEINPAHPICQRMKALYREDSQSATLDEFARLLYGLGVLAEGGLPPKPAEFTRLVASLLAQSPMAA